MRVEAKKTTVQSKTKIEQSKAKKWINSIYNAFGIVNNIKMQKVS